MRKYVISAACLFALSAAYAKFESVPARELEGAGTTAMYGQIADRRMVNLKAEPEHQGKPRYGFMYMQGKRYPFAVYSTEEGKEYDSAVIDLNANRDFTDDGLITIGKPSELKLPNGTSMKLIMRQAAENDKVYHLNPAEWFEGAVTVGDTEYKAVIFDPEMNGIKSGIRSRDYLVIDTDKDGKYNVQKDKVLPLRDRGQLDGKTWSMDVDTDKPDIVFRPFDGETGMLAIKKKLGSKFDGASVKMYARGAGMGGGYPLEMTFTDEKPVSIPTADYSAAYFTVEAMKDGKPGTVLSYSCKKPFKIKKDETLTFEIGKPEGLDVVVSNRKGKLNIDRKMKAVNGMELSSVGVMGDNGRMKRIGAPKVEIYSSETGDKLDQGAMEYG